ncbi:deoxyribonuclease-2-alpha [Solenopsis invicta]|uniref:deoxyribonuclease-2-alpha n=1 Tax=Solenopsis invicta TaxID=13686 RepID=UPI00193E09AD|nr:deoxyribonuclease-2-alpha [Solenopsis invicta]XP_011163301.2 deoxyribonuclease-2-alpha [Solenopsis invicta]XP_011163302.2 deoxyribonuclease-2-alpha [Solenopsis invicta]XP_011163303.2 deoxyribonuclease-2-alpha [Solenopsis invicta]XP_011163304.2 deoxyribonuclease-2-alpha [Solenopsis invicta]XP_011163305.2 deoxyribonuclease-2-alpha [Solenopsis invicta]XP_025991832.2 deoxyribonuclease-2-alpha [Solenopsis invicta]XP_025991833.2 deoxyribonuclease-2-alpha [Solenopsis invicta]
MMFSLLCISILLLACDAANPPRCRDENNRVVDWYVLYKLPKIQESSNPIMKSGLAYLYMTSNTVDKGWQLSTKKISAKNSTPGNTLTPLYNDSEASKTLWTMYNDDPPNRPSNAKNGHTKGVVLVNEKQGFWLIHSVPNYPPIPNSGNDSRRGQHAEEENSGNSEYDYPTSGMNFGQSFLCISVDGDQFDNIGKQLMINQIVVYRNNIPSFATKYPVLSDAAKQKRNRKGPFTSKKLLKSSGGVEFTSFAKSDRWDKDLYEDFVAPTLQTDLFAETWLNGRGRLPSDCEQVKKVYNVESIEVPTIDVGFTSSRDHSKWAVAVEGKANRSWVCVGDINRADTQYTRGGGTVCFNNPKVWKNYRKSVNDVEPCPKQYKAVRV